MGNFHDAFGRHGQGQDGYHDAHSNDPCRRGWNGQGQHGQGLQCYQDFLDVPHLPVGNIFQKLFHQILLRQIQFQEFLHTLSVLLKTEKNLYYVKVLLVQKSVLRCTV